MRTSLGVEECVVTFSNHLFGFRPRLRSSTRIIRDSSIRRVIKHDDILSDASKLLDVVRSVFEIDVGVDRLFVPHETQIPVGDSVPVERPNGLTDGDFVKPSYEEAM